MHNELETIAISLARSRAETISIPRRLAERIFLALRVGDTHASELTDGLIHMVPDNYIYGVQTLNREIESRRRAGEF